MNAQPCQRWHTKRDSYRPAGEPIQTARYEVHAFRSDSEARDFVTTHHYSGTYPAARFRFGLYHGPFLVGVAVFSHPCNDATLTNVFGGKATDAVELGRFVLLDSVPSNGETWFLGQCFAQLKGHVSGVLSFSDPVARSSEDGHTLFPGHVGTIYQAHNAVYLGRGTRRTLKLLPDGTVLSERALSKIRSQERGREYAVEQLVKHGAAKPDGDLRAWLAEWLPRVTRPLVHPGNHKYGWQLFARRRWSLPASLPYPKKED